ncbi:hypothetical protein J19TS2_22020 [Cohnella xylanilytica]|uniref:family 78 glycoside hydrolase catalytic domain n=1 Tax=Cohnella xylanilytica TaxID=557555 RepID=UPI001B166B8E|nr:family 78 glycoside hydrolase catalytic domain [Cohnella xylanilytica]GIO12647.1 hypothetical protein J19TS2_22020 [Cohnella xylanilytica]
MERSKRTPWQARWIWGGDEESPRNEWRWFRHSFFCPEDMEADAEAVLWLTADSRYEAYVNGTRIGRGPVRGYPTDLFYDGYDVGSLLRRGETNTIAIQVLHFGISNFYYLRGRGGLLAELAVASGDGETILAATGAEWRTARNPAQDPAVSRMSCQQAFAERIDARRFDGDWTSPDYGDDGWEDAREIGEAGMEPWVRLQPRDIPYLTEEPVVPARVGSLRRVVPYALSAFIDTYALMKNPGEENANPIGYAGAIATVLRLAEEAEVSVLLNVPGFGGGSFPKVLRLGQRLVPFDRWSVEPPLVRCRAKLPAGDHLLLYADFGPDHGHMHRIAVDCDRKIEWLSPIQAERPGGPGGASPFALIGPTFAYTMVDYVDQSALQQRWEEEAAKLANALAPLSAIEEIVQAGFPVRAIPYTHANDLDAFAPQFAIREAEAYAVPESLQRAATASADPGIVPVFKNGDTEFMLDFGKEWSGYLSFELEAEAGVATDWYGVEYRKGEYVQHTFGLDNTLRYITRAGVQSYTSPVRRGFRYLYVTVRGASSPVKIRAVRVLQSNYPAPEAGSFQCSDERLNRIWDISRHTTRLCMEDTFVDCPAYEQTFWVGDSRNEALVNYYAFGGADIVKRCLRLVPGSSFQTPLYVDQVPSAWTSVIPNWTFFWVVACREFAEHADDRAFAAEMLPRILYTLKAYLEHIDGDGLLNMRGWNLLDWAPIDQPGEGVVTHQNAMLVKALRDAAALAAFAGTPDEAAWCAEASDRLAAAINARLWSEERGAYLDCIHADGRRSDIFSMQTQVMALLSGVAEGDRLDRLTGYLTAAPEGFVQIGSPFMSFFYYEALMRSREPSAMRTMLDDIRRNYGFMIENGATTCWEMYGHTTVNRANENDLTRSHCHAWSAAPGYFLGAYALGVRAAAPGWKKAIVEPLPADLAWARGAVPLPGGGTIECEWTADAGRVVSLSVVAPEDVELDVRVPSGGEVRIRRLKRLPVE